MKTKISMSTVRWFATIVGAFLNLGWAFAGDPSGGLRDAFGPLYQPAPNANATPQQGPRQSLDAVRRWNEIALNASGLDHTPVAPGEQRVFGEQLGPARASRAMAIVHIAMFEAVNAVAPRYRSYAGVTPIAHASMEA